MDKDITVGGVRLRVTKRIDRCAATSVDPARGVSDHNIPQTLRKSFGHIDFGVYARVVTEGEITVGDGLFI